MGRRFFVIGQVADANFFSEEMNADYKEFYATIAFYSDAELANQVTPSAGTVKLTLTADGDNYLTIDNGQFNAADSYLETRTKPSAVSMAIKAKINLAGVTGAAYFKATLERF